ncbi:hypothetical protein ACFSBX_01830, partial [Halobellus rarus]
AVAFLSMTLAYAQLGYDADRTGAGAVEVASIGGIERDLAASFRAAVRDEAGDDSVDGGENADSRRERGVVAERIRADVSADVDRLAERHAGESRSLTVTFADAAATAWAETNCPGGPGRAFGPCRSVDGVVLQERAGEATPVAAAFRIQVVSPAESTTATVVVSAV